VKEIGFICDGQQDIEHWTSRFSEVSRLKLAFQ
jgi:hypothetical protein